jgi:predicted lipoprotein with Yx(FWY)xxD motif
MTATDAVHARTFRSGVMTRRLARRGLVPAAVLAGSLGATTFAGAAQPKAVVTTAKVTGLGTVLVSQHRVLYAKANDPKGHSTCTGGCATIWPPLIVSSKTAHHLGHIAGLGTIKRSNGKLQVAIHGRALYFNAGDHSLSHANGQGFANTWFTVHANGSLDRTTTSAPMATVPSTSQPASSPSSSTTTRPTSAPAGPAPTSPPATSPPPTSPPTTSPPPPTTTTAPPTTTTTTSGGGGGVGF